MSRLMEPCATCGHNQIVHFMSCGECARWCICKQYKSPTPSEKEQQDGE